MRVGGFCSGYGGLELALDMMTGGQVETVWMVENDRHARTVLRRHWPKMKVHWDLKQMDWDKVAPVDVMVGGFPCQPVSQAGRRKGTNDDRWLWPHIAEGIRRLAPGWVLLENVRGILTANGGAALGEVLGTLADLGFDAEWGCLRASDVGACHRRERWWCVARHPNRLAGESPFPFVRRPGAVAEPGTEPGALGPDRGPDPLTLLPTPTAADAKGSRNATSGRTNPDTEHHNGWTLNDIAYANLWHQYRPAIERHTNTFGTPPPPPTITNHRSKTGVSLNPVFVEWMMGVPEGWVTDMDLARTNQFRLLGNGVVPLQAAVAYSQLIDRLLEESHDRST